MEDTKYKITEPARSANETESLNEPPHTTSVWSASTSDARYIASPVTGTTTWVPTNPASSEPTTWAPTVPASSEPTTWAPTTPAPSEPTWAPTTPAPSEPTWAPTTPVPSEQFTGAPIAGTPESLYSQATISSTAAQYAAHLAQAYCGVLDHVQGYTLAGMRPQDYARTHTEEVNYNPASITASVAHGTYAATSLSSSIDTRAHVREQYASVGVVNYSTPVGVDNARESGTNTNTMPGCSSGVIPKDCTRTTPKPEDFTRITPRPEDFTRITPRPEDFTRTTPRPEDFTRTTPRPEDFTRTTPRPEDFTRTNLTPEEYVRASHLVEEYTRRLASREDYTRTNIGQECFIPGAANMEAYRGHTEQVASQVPNKATTNPDTTCGASAESSKGFPSSTTPRSHADTRIIPEDYSRSSIQAEYRTPMTQAGPTTEYKAMTLPSLPAEYKATTLPSLAAEYKAMTLPSLPAEYKAMTLLGASAAFKATTQTGSPTEYKVPTQQTPTSEFKTMIQSTPADENRTATTQAILPAEYVTTTSIPAAARLTAQPAYQGTTTSIPAAAGLTAQPAYQGTTTSIPAAAGLTAQPAYQGNISAEEYARARIGLGLSVDNISGLAAASSYRPFTAPVSAGYRVATSLGTPTTVLMSSDHCLPTDYRTPVIPGLDAGTNVRQAIENAVDTLEKSHEEAAVAMVMMVEGHNQNSSDPPRTSAAITAKHIQPAGISAEMRQEVIAYQTSHPGVLPQEIAAYFGKEWNMDIKWETVTDILEASRISHDTSTKALSEDAHLSSEEEDGEEDFSEDDDISGEMQNEMLQYKRDNCDATADQIAVYFSKQWCAQITAQSVADILADNATSFDTSKQTAPLDPMKNQPEKTRNVSVDQPGYDEKPQNDTGQPMVTDTASGYDETGGLFDVTVQEARHGLMKAIAYLVAHPNIAEDHIHTLWSIVKLLDDERVMEETETARTSKRNKTSETVGAALIGGNKNIDEEIVGETELVKIKQEVCGLETIYGEQDNSDCDDYDDLVDDDGDYSDDDDDDDDSDDDYVPHDSKTRFPTKAEMKSEATLVRIPRAARVGIHNTLHNNTTKKPRRATAKPKGSQLLEAGALKDDFSTELQCPECDERFDVFTDLLDHITRHSEERLLLARACGGAVDSANGVGMKKPVIRGRGRGRLSHFTAAAATARNITKTKASVKKKRKIRPQKCTICGRTFNDYSNFRRHLRLHAGLKPHACPTCHFSFIERNALNKHMRTHTGEKPFLCTTCGKRVTTLAGLQSHARLHTGEKPFKCTDCGKDFAQSSSLKRHMVVHTGERPYNCTQCGKNFPRSEDLKMHVRTHTGVKPYKCAVCDKSFIKSSYLHKHSRKHTGEKPYKCPTCGEAFSQSDILQKHIRVHTGERPYCCTVCGKTFTQSGSLYNHMKMHKHELGTSPLKLKSLPHHPPVAGVVQPPLSVGNSQSVSQHSADVKPPITAQSPNTPERPDQSAVVAPETAASRVGTVSQEMRIYPEVPPHAYLSQWRPY